MAMKAKRHRPQLKSNPKQQATFEPYRVIGSSSMYVILCDAYGIVWRVPIDGGAIEKVQVK